MESVEAVGTVRPRTSRISQVVTLVAVVVPPLGLVLAMGLLWQVGLPLGRCGPLRGPLRRLRVRDDDRLPPLLHAQGLRDRSVREGAARDSRLHDDAGPRHAMGDRPSQAPRALGQAGRPALAARRPRHRSMGRSERLRPCPRPAGCSAISGWSRAGIRPRSLRGPARADDRPALPALGGGHARDPVRRRVRGWWNRLAGVEGSCGAA